MIETDRLILLPLTYEQLVQYARCDLSLERSLNVKEISRTISAELREALEHTIMPHVADTSRNPLFSTLWTAIEKTEHCMIGDLCILGEPLDNGEIEIGYGTYDAFQGKGFMTEMVGGIIAWARTQPEVRSIRASTDQSHIASCRVLQKNGFILQGETAHSLHWKLELYAEG